MRTGLWFPVSSELIGLAIILSVLVFAIYCIFYLMRKSAGQVQNTSVTREFLDETEQELQHFGFPKRSPEIFSSRIIDTKKGVAIIRTPSKAGFSLCVHTQLSYTRFYFFTDFDFFDRPSAIVYLIGDGTKRAMLKINSESAMFSSGNLRFFEANPKDKSIFLDKNLSLEINNETYKLDKVEINEVSRAIDYIVNLSDYDSTYLKKWRKLK
jgi:hypothetical protein